MNKTSDDSGKYELEGGPSYPACYSLMEKIVAIPLSEAKTLIRWHILNILAGNADAHAKSISIGYNDNASTVFSPFYDLVCTAHCLQLDTKMAMSVGGGVSIQDN